MAEIRQVTIKLRDKQTTGGAIPSTAQMGEPFVNLYDGVIKLSGVTGGGFEISSQSGIFEVGSTLYNSKITNRININDNFIISGDTGKISTYNGITGAGLSGKFLSGITGGFVLGDISDISGVSDITRVQPGTNVNTGGTGNFPIVNIVDSPSFNNITFSGTATGGDVIADSVNATTLSGVTIYSGSTDLDTIIRDISGTGDITRVQQGTNTQTGGTDNYPTVNLVDSPSVNILSASGHVITNGTTYSGGTIQDDGIFTIDAVTQVEVDSDLLPSISLTYDLGGASNRWGTIFAQDTNLSGILQATGVTDSSLVSGRVVYAGAGGSLNSESGFEYDEATNTLKTGTIQIGNPGDSGTTTTIYGDIIVVGESISGFTSQLYIEDNLIELNFNPTASTTSTSLGAGWSIQDGSGVSGTDVLFDIRGASTGLANRSFTTNLENIRVGESGTVSSPNGLYVIKTNDLLDGGTY